MKKLVFALLFFLGAMLAPNDSQAQVAWPGGSATISALESTDTSYTVRNNLTFVDYDTLTADQTFRLTNARGLRAGASIYVRSYNAVSGGVDLKMPVLVVPDGDTLTLDSAKFTVVGLFWDGSNYRILQKSTY